MKAFESLTSFERSPRSVRARVERVIPATETEPLRLEVVLKGRKNKRIIEADMNESFAKVGTEPEYFRRVLNLDTGVEQVEIISAQPETPTAHEVRADLMRAVSGLTTPGTNDPILGVTPTGTLDAGDADKAWEAFTDYNKHAERRRRSARSRRQRRN